MDSAVNRTPPSSPLLTEITTLEDSLEHLQELLSRLPGQLSPVLVPGDEPPRTKDPAEAPCSALKCHLLRLNGKVAHMRSRIEFILTGLEI